MKGQFDKIASPAPTGSAPPSMDVEDATTLAKLGPEYFKPKNPDVQPATDGSNRNDSSRQPQRPYAGEKGKGTG